MKKIAFLLIDKSFNIYHVISLASELSKNQNFEIIIFCTKRNRSIIDSLIGRYRFSNIGVVTLRPYWYFTLPHYLEIKLQFRKVLFYKYKALLKTFDAFVCTLYNDLILKEIVYPVHHMHLIFASHGIVNRPYSFNNDVTKFDLILISGIKEKEIRTQLGQLNPQNNVMSGYLKDDLTNGVSKINFFNNSNPTIVYNPHWEKDVSSFFNYGFKILDFFAQNHNYNLIFAPHAFLKDRNMSLRLRLRKYNKYKNVLIDLGSEYSNDMTYLKSADLYLGDASSQALEFVLIEERPCLFLDAHDISQSNESHFISWQLGRVITDLTDFNKMLDEAFKRHKKDYRIIQAKLVHEMFYRTDKSASEIAAQAVIKLLTA